ncbi:phosphate transport system substrate-binding protein [Variovorax sp. HW608]|uniref:phosphate ABC transporter substrate-binding protein PstS n=1 Tax=Variovorax sp. HW608 TaxID=1034889 RepID=UPI000820035F|nr:phosphate ABC transporter substrate-binding protein PstS [Variovorax sp. HW608]SCK21845.1 phosphate transport system substrate-binding protein [Variovorax sp. HW608]
MAIPNGPRALQTVLGMTATMLLAQTASATDIAGSGSTFVYPVMLRWASGYHTKTNVKVNYLAIGSGSGIQQVKAGQVAFGASDKPLAPDELKSADLMQFPLVIGGVVPVVNLDGIAPGRLRFTGELLADIYLGKVTNWNDAAIAALNPEVELPNLRITAMHRLDASGTTFNFVNYLSKVSDEWKTKVGEGTMVRWPAGSGGSGNDGVARYVNYVKGSIGYVELAYALEHKMTYPMLRNRSGAFVGPTPDSFEAAAASTGWTKPDFYELLTDAPGEKSWPITATTFALMPRNPRNPAQTAEALRFFKWSLEQGKADARALDYVPLPDSLVQRIEAYWAEPGK